MQGRRNRRDGESILRLAGILHGMNQRDAQYDRVTASS